jgi:hypothetical protein
VSANRELPLLFTFEELKSSTSVICSCRAADDTREVTEVLQLIQEINCAASFDSDGNLSLGNREIKHHERIRQDSKTIAKEWSLEGSTGQECICVGARGVVEIIRGSDGYFRATMSALR